MDFLTRIAEEKIREAMDRGEFENLALKGKPVDLSPSPSVPDELRLAYTVLKNAGFLPPEMELQKEIRSLKDLLRTLDDGEARMRIVRDVNARVLKLNSLPLHSCFSQRRGFERSTGALGCGLL